MSGFDDEWLALREPVDERSRDVALADALAEHLRTVSSDTPDVPLRILDLGSGTGSNFRCLAPRLGPHQAWTLIDNDTALLERVPLRLGRWAEARRLEVRDEADRLSVRGAAFAASVDRRRHDLARELDALLFADHDLVTGSALLDLAGAAWLDALAARCAAATCAVHLVLSYDGRVGWSSEVEDDAAVAERFDAHQRQDKGLGTALGPDAAARFAASLRGHGFAVSTAASDWRLGAADAGLQRALASGFAAAAREIDPAFARRADAWLARRHELIDRDRSGLLVGHLDVLALPGPDTA